MYPQSFLKRLFCEPILKHVLFFRFPALGAVPCLPLSCFCRRRGCKYPASSKAVRGQVERPPLPYPRRWRSAGWRCCAGVNVNMAIGCGCKNQNIITFEQISRKRNRQQFLLWHAVKRPHIQLDAMINSKETADAYVARSFF